MKIVHIHQYFNEGYGYQENILPGYHQELGHDVILITSTYSDGHNNEKRKKKTGVFEENNFLVKRIETVGEFKHRFVLFKNLYKELEVQRPDFIYHHSPTAPSIITVSKYKKKNANVTLVVDNHADLEISGRNRLWKFVYYNTFWKYILKKVDKNIDCYFGVTPDRCLFLSNELGIPKEKISLLPIGADVKYVDKIKKSKQSIREKINVNDKDILICHGGKMSYNKKTDYLIDAFMKIDNPNLKLVLFGQFIDTELEKLIEKDKRIIFLGWCNRNKVLSIMKASDVGVWNGNHTTLLEDAVACELPLILRKYGSTEHLVKNNGTYIKNSSVEEMAYALRTLITQKNIKKWKLGAKEMKKELSYTKIAKDSLLICKEM